MRAGFIVAMLSLFMLVNSADKAVLGLAALPIIAEMHLSHAQFGLLGSGFFMLFSVSALVVGWLGDRFSPKWLLAGLAFVWAAAMFPLVAPVGFGAFLASRVVLGAGEGPALPIALHTAYARFGDERRSLVTSFIQAGIPLGAAIAAFGVTSIVSKFGWHAAFGALSAVSALWCAGWICIYKPADSHVRSQLPDGKSAPPAAAILSLTILGVAVAAFAAYWLSALLFIWLPAYLETVYALTTTSAGLILTAAWIVQVPLFPLVGSLSQMLQRRGYSTQVTRVTLATTALAIAGAAMVAMTAAGSLPAAIALAMLCLGATVVVITLIPPVVGEVVPQARRGLALGGCVAFGALGGIAAPIVLGRIVDAAAIPADGYRSGFLTSGILLMLFALVSRALMRPARDRAAFAGAAPVSS